MMTLNQVLQIGWVTRVVLSSEPRVIAMSEFSPFEQDVLLKGILIVQAVGRRDGRPQPRRRVVVRACGFV